ncbi:hypothetical protein MAR_015630 [Mya arenaria]|uniref:Uncharacterized protein n=2 Tax=Mya arenaria TaxID=6604 RepID=A0ABY7FR17_MYAAR|nr:hypothetical protein MAR_015630 [Mya arenaria]
MAEELKKTKMNTFEENPEAEETVERLCVVCIQALAELDQWQDVLPMIQNVYGDSMSVLQYVKYFGCMIASKLAYPSISMLLKIAAASVAMAMFLKISLDGDLLSRLGQATLLWENAIQILKTVFSPYRPGR